SVDLIHRVLHDALHLALCDMRILLVARTRGAFDSGMCFFDGAVSEALSNDALRFFCKMRVNTRTRRLAIPRMIEHTLKAAVECLSPCFDLRSRPCPCSSVVGRMEIFPL